MKVVVAVLSYNRLDLWRRTVDSLYRTSYPFDLVLYDNGSTDGTEKEVAALGGTCNDSENHWIGHGLREAMRLAMAHEPDLILFTADDYEYREGWLEQLVSFWKDAPETVAITCCNLEPEFRWNGISGTIDAGGERALVRNTAPGANWSFRASLWKDIELLVPDNAHKYDKAVTRALQAEGMVLAVLDLNNHIGEGKRSWSDTVIVPEGTPVDKAAWGLAMRSLNIGTGNTPIEGAINHDIIKHRPEIDVAWDLNDLPWPWDENLFDTIIAKSVFEHLRHNLVVSLDECWRILCPGGQMTIKVPYWKSKRAHQDPTHIWRGFTMETLGLFDPDTQYGQTCSYYTARKWKIIDGPSLSSDKAAIWATMAVRK